MPAVGWLFLGFALVALPSLVAMRYQREAVDWFLQRGQGSPVLIAGWVAFAHLSLLVGWIGVYIFARLLTDGEASNARAGWVVVPMILVHMPFVWTFLLNGGGLSRADDRGRVRALRWVGAPFGVLGLGLCLTAFFVTFLT